MGIIWCRYLPFSCCQISSKDTPSCAQSYTGDMEMVKKKVAGWKSVPFHPDVK